MPQTRNHLRMRSVWMSLLLHGLCPKTRFRRQVQDLPCLLRRASTGTTTDRRVTFIYRALQRLLWSSGIWMHFEFIRHDRCHCIYEEMLWNNQDRPSHSLRAYCISRYLSLTCTKGDAVFTWRNFIHRRTIGYIIIIILYLLLDSTFPFHSSFQ